MIVLRYREKLYGKPVTKGDVFREHSLLFTAEVLKILLLSPYYPEPVSHWLSMVVDREVEYMNKSTFTVPTILAPIEPGPHHLKGLKVGDLIEKWGPEFIEEAVWYMFHSRSNKGKYTKVEEKVKRDLNIPKILKVLKFVALCFSGQWKISGGLGYGKMKVDYGRGNTIDKGDAKEIIRKALELYNMT